MKSLLIPFLTLFLSLPALGKSKEPTAYEFFSMINKTAAQKLSSEVRSVPLKNIRMEGRFVNFTFQGVRLQFEYVGKKSVYFKMNGRSFSTKDFYSLETLEKAIKNRFGFVTADDRFAWENLHNGRQNAAFDGTSFGVSNDDFADHAADGDQDSKPYEIRFEDMDIKNYSWKGNSRNRHVETNHLKGTDFDRDIGLKAELAPEVWSKGMAAAENLGGVAMFSLASAMINLGQSPAFQTVFDLGPGVESIATPQSKGNGFL